MSGDLGDGDGGSGRVDLWCDGECAPGWTTLRDRWELGHTIGFVLFTVSFALLIALIVRPTDLRDHIEQAPRKAAG